MDIIIRKEEGKSMIAEKISETTKRHFPMELGINEKCANLDDVFIHYAEIGKGDPIIFIHGTGLDCRMWEDQLMYFSKKYHTVAYDMRGFGLSGRLNGGKYSTSSDLNKLMDLLQINSSNVVAHSRGGRTAITFALEHPEKVKSLVLGGAGINGLPLSNEFKEIKYEVALIAQKLGIDNAKRVWINSALFASALKNEVLMKKLREMLNDYEPWHWLNQDTEVRIKPEAIERLEDIAVPTLVILGTLDIPYIQNTANILAERIPNAQLEIIKDAGHMNNMEQPQLFNSLVSKFLNSLPTYSK